MNTNDNTFITTDISTALLMLPRFHADLFQPSPDLMRRIALAAIGAIEAESDAALHIPATPDEVRLYEDMITDEDRMFSDVHSDGVAAGAEDAA